MNQDHISYALAKQVPDMERGFTICTNYGDIVIEPGMMANLIAAQVKLTLRCELFALDQATPVETDGRDHYGFTQEANVIGGSHVRHREPQPTPEASCGPLTAAQCPLCLQELNRTSAQQAGSHQ